MKNNISNEIRKNLKEAAKKAAPKSVGKDAFNSDALIKSIVETLKKTSGVSDIQTTYEDYSVISGDYIYFKETMDDGTVLNWVLALGIDEREDEDWDE